MLTVNHSFFSQCRVVIIALALYFWIKHCKRAKNITAEAAYCRQRVRSVWLPLYNIRSKIFQTFFSLIALSEMKMHCDSSKAGPNTKLSTCICNKRCRRNRKIQMCYLIFNIFSRTKKPGGIVMVATSVSQSVDLSSITLFNHTTDCTNGNLKFLSRPTARKK